MDSCSDTVRFFFLIWRKPVAVISDKSNLFRGSARFYLRNKQMYEEYRLSEKNEQDDRFYSFILEDLHFVENTLEEIKEKCGTAARLIIYLLYVENRTQEEVVGLFGITRRQLQYSLARWMDTAFTAA